jgi:hypothetical protein
MGLAKGLQNVNIPKPGREYCEKKAAGRNVPKQLALPLNFKV